MFGVPFWVVSFSAYCDEDSWEPFTSEYLVKAALEKCV